MSKSFEQVINECTKSKTKWTDPDFPPADSSLYAIPERVPKLWPKVTEWRRITEFLKAPEMFISGTEPGDVIQGVLGDCWFLGALSVVATCQDLIDRCIPQKELNEWGVYEFIFYKNGEWVKVLVDDYIPLSKGKIIFSRCKDVNECWVMLMEKAYAKLHKCYENLEGGSETYALVDMTGGAPETVEIDNAEVRRDLPKLWERMKKFYNLGYLLGCCLLNPDGAIEANTGSGILQNHAYGILEVKELDKTRRLIRIRNPWGEGEWKGKWADHSKEWSPEILKLLKYSFAEDGTFWMEFADFCKQFNRFYILRMFNNEWKPFSIKGEWKGASAGGCGNYPTWKNNPQFGFTLPEESDVFVTLMQKDLRKDSGIPIGYLVLKNENPTKKVQQIKMSDVVGQTTFNAFREVSNKFYLKPGSYIISPSTFYPNKCTSFLLRVYSQSNFPIELFELSANGGASNSTTGKIPTSNLGANSETVRASKPSQLPSINSPERKPPHTNGTFKGYGKKQNPLYQTVASEIGTRAPNEIELPEVWHGRTYKFTKSN